jgi:hypothetical protein
MPQGKFNKLLSSIKKLKTSTLNSSNSKPKKVGNETKLKVEVKPSHQTKDKVTKS